KVFRNRAKELFVWSSSFKEVPEVVYYSDDESVKNEADINVVDNTINNEEHNKEVGNSAIESSIPYPPGFTPRKENVTFEQEVQGEECICSQHSSRVFEEVEKSDINIQSDGRVIRDIRM
nr:hypothetical protein [Tanacetum cinerariifolium]